MSTFEQLEQDRAAIKFWAAFANLLEQEYPDLYSYFTRSASNKKENEPPTRNSHSFFFSLKQHWDGEAVNIVLESQSQYVSFAILKSLDKREHIERALMPLFPDGFRLQPKDSDVLISTRTPFFDVKAPFGQYKKEVHEALKKTQWVLEVSRNLPLESKKR
jgi:hypothetical protein